MVESNSRRFPNTKRWHKELYRANRAVGNYLKLLIFPEWFMYKYGDSFKNSSASNVVERTTYGPTIRCTQVHSCPN